jgi:hypothetical protein
MATTDKACGMPARMTAEGLPILKGSFICRLGAPRKKVSRLPREDGLFECERCRGWKPYGEYVRWEAGRPKRTGRRRKICRDCYYDRPEFRRLYPSGRKYCPVCKESLPILSFGASKKSRESIGLQSYCADCDTTEKRKRRYNMVDDDFDLLYGHFDGKCSNPACLEPLTKSQMFVDHDHATGIVRGFICKNCNDIAKILDGHVPQLRGMIDYLENPPVQDILRRTAAERAMLAGQTKVRRTRSDKGKPRGSRRPRCAN